MTFAIGYIEFQCLVVSNDASGESSSEILQPDLKVDGVATYILNLQPLF